MIPPNVPITIRVTYTTDTVSVRCLVDGVALPDQPALPTGGVVDFVLDAGLPNGTHIIDALGVNAAGVGPSTSTTVVVMERLPGPVTITVIVV